MTDTPDFSEVRRKMAEAREALEEEKAEQVEQGEAANDDTTVRDVTPEMQAQFRAMFQQPDNANTGRADSQ